MKKIMAMLLAMVMLLSFAGCGGVVESPKEVVVDTSYFSDLNKEEDNFEGIICYYPDSPWGETKRASYKKLVDGDFKVVFTYYSNPEDYIDKDWSFSAFPVIFYEDGKEIPYRFDCVMVYHYSTIGSGGYEYNYRKPFTDMIIVTDNHKYTITNIDDSTGMENAINIMSLGSKGFDMIKDICSCSKVDIRIADTFGYQTDFSVKGSTFDFVLEILEKFESSGCADYNFEEFDDNITVE
ncbi:MAG: hypothetical protein IJP05_07575 [Oscillospiraceae bacterium]|nr:hypothetical protein [Oscillospiraceae bacterium]MBQ6802911.1 hypothetical protein [Oscillospiraceae bacterium]